MMSGINKHLNIDKHAMMSAWDLSQRADLVKAVTLGLAVFGVGMLVGLGLGMLTAPRSGPHMRKHLRRRMEDLREGVAAAVHDGG